MKNNLYVDMWFGNTPEEAEEKLTNDICEGRENAPEECCYSGCDEIKEITE